MRHVTPALKDCATLFLFHELISSWRDDPDREGKVFFFSDSVHLRTSCAQDTRSQCFIAASQQEPLPRFQCHRGLQINVGSSGPSHDNAWEALAVSLTRSPRHPRLLLRTLLSHHMVFSCPPTTLPVGSCPIISIVRFFSSVQWFSSSQPPGRHSPLRGEPDRCRTP